MFRREKRESFGDLLIERLDKWRAVIDGGLQLLYGVRVIEEAHYRGQRFQHISRRGQHFFQVFSLIDNEILLSETGVAEGIDLAAYARIWWSVAHAQGTLLVTRAFRDEPADGVPWEIHEIEDEVAYESALAAYLENQT